MPEQFRLDQCLRERGQVDGVEAFFDWRGELPLLRIVGDEARESDCAGDDFLARSGWAEDERGESTHSVIHPQLVAHHVLGEDALPYLHAQGFDWLAVADDLVVDIEEGAP